MFKAFVLSIFLMLGVAVCADAWTGYGYGGRRDYGRRDYGRRDYGRSQPRSHFYFDNYGGYFYEYRGNGWSYRYYSPPRYYNSPPYDYHRDWRYNYPRR